MPENRGKTGAAGTLIRGPESAPRECQEGGDLRILSFAAVLLSALLLLGSAAALLHHAGLFYPSFKVDSIQAKVLRSDGSDKLMAAPYRHLTGQRPAKFITADYPGQLKILADGQDLKLSALQSGSFSKKNYQIDRGYICFYAPTGSSNYSAIRPVVFKFAGFVALAAFSLGLGCLAFGLVSDDNLRRRFSSFLIRSDATAKILAASARDTVRRMGLVWAPIFGASATTGDGRNSSKKLSKKTVAGACFTLAAVVYLNTGTLCPLNLFYPLVVDRGFSTVVNIDHDYHYSLFMLVDGHGAEVKPPYNMLFRRILFPALAYPFMKTAGYVEGGILAGAFYNLLALALFGFYVARRWGKRAGTFACLILSVYPGYAYFLGLPSCYAIIFPACLGSLIALSEIERRIGKRERDASWTVKDSFEVFFLSLGAGVLCLGYDIIGFVLPTVTLLCLLKKRWLATAASCAGTVLPLALWCVFLYFSMGKESLLNSNTSTFANAILAWTSIFSGEAVLSMLQKVPQVLAFGWQTFLGSTFYFLPLLFAFCLIASRFTRDNKLQLCELLFITTSLCLFLFFNLPPDCTSSGLGGQGLAEWQLKGSWTVRLYQPLFAVYVLFSARQLSNLGLAKVGWKLVLGTAFVLCMAGNTLTSFGTFLGNPLGLSANLYDAFFPGGDKARFVWNLATYGRLPLGFYDCRKAEQTQTERDASGRAALTAIRQAIPAR